MITWSIGEKEEGIFTLDQDDTLVLKRDNVAELLMFIYATSRNDEDVIQWDDMLGNVKQTVAESKQAYTRLEMRLQEITDGGHDEGSDEPNIEAIRQRVAAITPGTWTVERGHEVVTDDPDTVEEWGSSVATVAADTDAIFMAHAPMDIMILLEEVRLLRFRLYNAGPDIAV